MGIYIFNEYEMDGFVYTDYTKDGVAVSHTVKTPLQTEPIEPQEPAPSINEEILFETQYQTLLLEMGGI